jgi:immunoglobulin-binding protein 1
VEGEFVNAEICSISSDSVSREASFNAPTSKEILQEASEMDGTLGGEEKSEQKRKEEEEWALYTEAHPKGMGNTMNRG